MLFVDEDVDKLFEFGSCGGGKTDECLHLVMKDDIRGIRSGS